jgi:hypothetical protein
LTSFAGRSPPQHVFSNLVCSLILIIPPLTNYECFCHVVILRAL